MSIKQVVSVPTRSDYVLDLIVTNLEGFYRDLVATAPLGSSDHNITKRTSSYKGNVGSAIKSASKKYVRRSQSARDVPSQRVMFPVSA